MIAALPMYDFTWVRAATDRLWAYVRDGLRQRGIAAPDALTRGRKDQAVWVSAGLLLGQTCGYPYWTRLRPYVDVVGTPIFGFAGCEGPHHRSFLVAHRDSARETLAEFRGMRAAVNSGDSNTGMNLFRAAVAPLAGGKPFFADVVVTGSHAQSLYAVAEAEADIAAIDCVSYALLARGAPQLMEKVKIVGKTPASPALPFIASLSLPRATRAALRVILLRTPPIPELGLASVAFLPETAYVRVEELERGAAEQGYPRLA